MTLPNSPFNTEAPSADVARQAVHALRGYAYQVLATALAWVDLGDRAKLFVEVAEDYAVVADSALRAVQVKDTRDTGSITLNTPSVRDAVAAFVDLVERNPGVRVHLRFLTTSEIGRERIGEYRPNGVAGLEYWRQVATSPRVVVTPLRTVLEGEGFPASVRGYCKKRNDEQLRRELIARISWDCGNPDISTLREELEARLVVVGRDKFGVPANEARALADTLVYGVLKTAVTPTKESRVLNRAGLYELIDATTRISVPRRSLDLQERIDSALQNGLRSLVGASEARSVSEVGWLISGSALPMVDGVLRRASKEAVVEQSLDGCGVAMTVGATGLGKSLLCQSVARRRARVFSVGEFRGTTAAGARSRLDLLFGYLGEFPARAAVILDDIHHLDDPGVIVSLGRVLVAAGRRGLEVLATCYVRPAPSTLARLGLAPHCVVACEYFSETEVNDLVRQHGGTAERWGRIAYLCGAQGHPQLTHAFVIGVASRRWRESEFDKTIGGGFTTADLMATRDGAKRTLRAGFPNAARTLLYRLSLVVGRFNRALALSVGAVEPAIAQAGEHLDLLIGPWIETLDVDSLRVSPLAGRFGLETLADAEQQNIHENIATHLLKKKTLTIQDANAILCHGIAGKSRDGLGRLSWAILQANEAVREALAEHLIPLRVAVDSEPLYADDGMVSVALRMAQFRLATSSGDNARITRVAAALLRESQELPDDARGGHLKTMAQMMVLGTRNIGSFLENWVNVLADFGKRVAEKGVLETLFRDANGASMWGPGSIVGGLFSIGSANLQTMEQLEGIVERMDGVDPDTRALMLQPIHDVAADYSVLVNGPWAREEELDDFDSRDAVERYTRICRTTRNWGVPELTMQCIVAKAIMLDELEGDASGAAEWLEEAIGSFGRHWMLVRALAKVELRREAFGEALVLFREIADTVGGDSNVERAFALRDAAMSAANCGEWTEAERWFWEAERLAAREDLGDFKAMAVGLKADAGVAALEGGRRRLALERMVGAVDGLRNVDARGGLRGAHCHLAVRRAVVMTNERLARIVDSAPSALGLVEAGMCSNPSPARGVLEARMPHVDLSWYLLAEAEVASGLDVSICSQLYERLEDGPIAIMEARLRLWRIERAIADGDVAGFARALMPYCEAAVYVTHGGDDGLEGGSAWAEAPGRAAIPALDPVDLGEPGVRAGEHAMIAFGMHAVMAGERGWLADLRRGLGEGVGNVYPGELVLKGWDELHGRLSEADGRVVAGIRRLMKREDGDPADFVRIGLLFFGWVENSALKRVLWPRMAAWQLERWRRILIGERFRLVRPRYSVPMMEEVLGAAEMGRGFVARVLLAGCDAVGVRLNTDDRAVLRECGER